MRYVSSFGGIGGFDVGFDRAGMTCVAQIEIDKHCRTILKRHWPDVPLYGDIADVSGTDLPPFDVLVGGFPCQDVAKANVTRKGLAGDRSGLFFQFTRLVDEYARLVDETNPRWIVLENVDGLLTSGRKPKPGIDEPDIANKDHWVPDRGADFETVLRVLADLGYLVGWRVVNTRFVRGTSRSAPAQQRRRVVIVGHRGDHPGARDVLADFGTCGDDAGLDPERRRLEAGRRAPGPRASEDGLELIFRKSRRAQSKIDFSTWVEEDFANTLTGFDAGLGRATQVIVQGDRVRILTHREWERLQGFDDDWTAGVPASARWHMIGNAVSTNMSEWLGRRIMSVPMLAATAT